MLNYTDIIMVYLTIANHIFLLLGSISFAYPFADVAALMDLLYITISSSVHPNLQTLAPSSPPHLSRCIWSSSVSLAFRFSLLHYFCPVFGVGLYARHHTIE